MYHIDCSGSRLSFRLDNLPRPQTPSRPIWRRCIQFAKRSSPTSRDQLHVTIPFRGMSQLEINPKDQGPPGTNRHDPFPTPGLIGTHLSLGARAVMNHQAVGITQFGVRSKG